jgi:hypothetical protein
MNRLHDVTFFNRVCGIPSPGEAYSFTAGQRFPSAPEDTNRVRAETASFRTVGTVPLTGFFRYMQKILTKSIRAGWMSRR